MPLSRRTSYLVVLASGLAACSDATSPAEPRATVTVQAQSLAVTTVPAGAVTWIEFTVPLRIDNAGPAALTFQFCASRVEAREGDGWSAAWTPVCAAERGAPITIPAGESRELGLTVQAAIQGPGGPPWRAGPTATSYRFAAGLMPAGASGLIPIVPSNTFSLAGGT
jgi:hypothetical protein